MRKMLFMLFGPAQLPKDAWGCGPIKLQKLSNDLLGFLNLVKVLMKRCD